MAATSCAPWHAGHQRQHALLVDGRAQVLAHFLALELVVQLGAHLFEGKPGLARVSLGIALDRGEIILVVPVHTGIDVGVEVFQRRTRGVARDELVQQQRAQGGGRRPG
jgi:hypothetical protein